jgi:hypothetical protein
MELFDLMILRNSEIPIFDFIWENLSDLRDYRPVNYHIPKKEGEKISVDEKRNNQTEREKDETIKSFEKRKIDFAEEYWFNKQDLDIILFELFPDKEVLSLECSDKALCKRAARRIYNHVLKYPAIKDIPADYSDYVDYFERIITENRPSDDESDQCQLKAIKDWNDDTDKDNLLDLILDGKFRVRWEHLLVDTEHSQLTALAINRLKD